MKTKFASALLLCIIFAVTSAATNISVYSGLPAWAEQMNLPVIPDAMGWTAVSDNENARQDIQIAPTDEFTVFPGWPISQASGSFEGGIFCNMDDDDTPEIVYCIGTSIYAWNINGTPVPGWPVTITYAFEGAPSYGDIDGDNIPEIVAGSKYGSSTGKVCAYELNGTPVTGFPVEHGYCTRTTPIADIDGDGDMEIIATKRQYPTGSVYVYNGNGTIYPGWPKTLDSVPSASCSIGDITGDGQVEIIAQSYNAIHAWSINGTPVPGFPFMLTNSAVNSYSSCVLADLDNDGLNEIIFGSHVLGGGGYVFVLNGDGTQAVGWPKFTNYWVYGPPAVGDIDGDGNLDVAVGDQVLSGTPTNKLYAWNRFGTPLPGFPVSNIPAINNQIVLADLDEDGAIELLFDDNTTYTGGIGQYTCYNHNGTPVANWRLTFNGSSFFHMPALADANGDGFLDINGAGGTTSTNVYLWSSDITFDEEDIIIPVWQYNVQHTGLYPSNFVAPTVSVTLTPINPPIQIPSGGGTFSYSFTITNTGTVPTIFDAWTEAVLPNTSVYGPILLRNNLQLAPGASLSRTMTQSVPTNAPAGEYTYRLCAGDYPAVVTDSDEFNFVKSAAVDAGNTVNGWNVLGWEDEIQSIVSSPENFALHNPSPNPFNNSTVISFNLPDAGEISLKIYDISGREIQELGFGIWDLGYREEIHSRLS